ncbi:MAG: DsbA family protein [Patescibacteria group bacterium]|nr:DsbA family protein [Patescibacteria group bacterium]
MSDRPAENQSRSLPWFARWWGILAIAFVIIFILSAVYLVCQGLVFGKSVSELTNQAQANLTAEEIFLGSPYSVETADDPAVGGTSSLVTIVEFCDWHSSYCQETAKTIRDIVSVYNGSVKLIFRDFVTDSDERAGRLAEAAQCANEQGKFWIMHDRLFLQSELLNDEQIYKLAGDIGLDQNNFKSCYESRRYQKEVQADTQAGLAAGIRGVPTFFFNGYKAEGALTAQNFVDIINYLLPGQELESDTVNTEINGEIN